MGWRKKTPRFKIEYATVEVLLSPNRIVGNVEEVSLKKDDVEKALNKFVQSRESSIKTLISVTCEVPIVAFPNEDGKLINQIKITLAYIPK